MEYNEKLCFIMETRHITPSTLAKLTGLSVNGIKFILSGKKSPTIGTLERICLALNINIKDLFDEEECGNIDKYNDILSFININDEE